MGLFIAGRYKGLTTKEAINFSQDDLNNETKENLALLTTKVQTEIKTNRYSPKEGVLVYTNFQAEAHKALTKYYTELFLNGNHGFAASYSYK